MSLKLVCNKRIAFNKALHSRDKTLYYKWVYGALLSDTERDVLLCVANQVRHNNK